MTKQGEAKQGEAGQSAVRQGVWAAGTDITIADVAARAGVSIRTVSRVLNRSPKVNAQTRERIEAAIEGLAFRPSARARGLATGRSFLIGMVHNDRNALVLDAVQRGMASAAAASGYDIIAHSTPTGDDGSVGDVLDFVRRSRVDGLIILAPVSGVPGLPEALNEVGVPAVALSSIRLQGFGDILVSDERGAAAAVANYLVSLGHTRIACVSGPSQMVSAHERRSGFVSALAAAGTDLFAEAEGDYGFDAGIAAAERLLSLAPPPTAIFAANDIMAAAVLKVASVRGLAVPRDLSVVGFDGSVLARMVNPALTTIHRPMADMARLATAALLDLIEGGKTDIALHAELRLTIGESSGPPPG